MINKSSLRNFFAKGPKYRELEKYTGNITLQFLWIPSRIMPDNGQKWKGGLRYSFRMGEECEIADTN